MKRNLRIVQIKGFRGLLLTLFIISCLIAGFIAFPGFLTMNLWNYLAAETGSFPLINFYQGVLLWAIIVFSIFIFKKRKFIVSFSSKHELTEDEVKDVVSRIKSVNLGLNKKVEEDLSEERKEVHSSNDNQNNLL